MKKTVKIISLIVAMLILMPAIVSCQSDKTSTSVKNKFVGEWVSYGQSFISTTRAVLIISDAGTFKYKYYVGNDMMIDEVGTYLIDGDELTITFESGRILDEQFVYVSSGDTPYIKDSEGKKYTKES